MLTATLRHGIQISLKEMRPDHIRKLNPTPYKVAVDDKIYGDIHDCWGSIGRDEELR